MKYLSPICLLLCIQLSYGQTEVIENYDHSDVSFIGTEETEEQVISVLSKKEIQFYDISSGKLSKAYPYDTYAILEGGYSMVRKGEKLFFIDRHGNLALKGKFSLASTVHYGLVAVQKKGQAYIIDMREKAAFEGKYDRVHSFTDKVALVEKEGAVFFIDTDGKRLNIYSVIKSKLHDNGCYVFQTEKGLSLINREGNIIGTSDYTKLEFIDPIIYFEKADNRGFLNHEGKEFLYFDGYSRPRNKPLKSPFYYIYTNKIGALADTTGRLLTDFEYNHLLQATADRIVVTKHTPTGSKKGLINLQGEVIVPVQWDNITKPRDSELFTVRGKNGDIRYENMVSADGEYFLPVENQNFKTLKYCSEDLAVVRLADTIIYERNRSRNVLVNRKGEILTKEPYHAIAKFVNGIAAAYRYVDDGKQMSVLGGYLKNTGEFKPVNAMNCQNFHDGYAVFFTNDSPRKYGLIDQSMNLIVPIDSGYESIKGFFSEDLFVVQRGKLWGYIDQYGKEIIPPQYQSAEPFFKGLGQVNHNIYINREGDTIVNGLNDGMIRPFVNGLAPFLDNELWGYVNEKGQVVVPPSYRGAGNFANGYAVVSMNESIFSPRLGVIDTLGEKILELQYQQITPLGNMSNGNPVWRVQQEDGTYTLVTLGGKPVLGENYKKLQVLHNTMEESGLRTLIIGVKGEGDAKLLKVKL